MDSSYISLFRDSTPSFFLLSYLNYIELLSILLQNYNPVATKTDIGRRKDEEGRLNCRRNTICILPRKVTFAFETAISETAVSKNNIKKKL